MVAEDRKSVGKRMRAGAFGGKAFHADNYRGKQDDESENETRSDDFQCSGCYRAGDQFRHLLLATG